MIGQLCQIEIQVSKLETAVAFYQKVFGWQPVPALMHNYVVMAGAGGASYGISVIAKEAFKPSRGHVLLYFNCSDPDEVVAKAQAYGGQLILPRKLLPSYGWITIIADPDGQRFGLFKAYPSRAQEEA